MNWKAVIIGALTFWLVINIVGMLGTGFVIHQKILDPLYRAHESFWIPELNQDPPDMASVLPRWLLNSFVTSLVVAGIYVCVRGSFDGPGWKRGLMWGLSLGIFAGSMTLGWSGVFNLPMTLWFWWIVDSLILFPIGGAVMGWAAERFGGLET